MNSRITGILPLTQFALDYWHRDPPRRMNTRVSRRKKYENVNRVECVLTCTQKSDLSVEGDYIQDFKYPFFRFSISSNSIARRFYYVPGTT